MQLTNMWRLVCLRILLVTTIRVYAANNSISERQEFKANIEKYTLTKGNSLASSLENGDDTSTTTATEVTTTVDDNQDDEQGLREGSVVVTENGSVQGYIMQGKEIQQFVDIPYGKFASHFQDPTNPDRWNEVSKIKEHRKRCPQLEDGNTYVGELNCLTLSIFVPKDAANLSVLFHIHEGNFVSGSADPALYGPEYIVPKGVALVLPNYRLGPLGFLCLQNETAPGNAALKDLTLALNWTKHNIAKFGGNPSDITVSGDGTAGALVGYLTLSPKSRNYITKAITESGSVLSHWAIDRNPKVTATRFAEEIRKNYDTTSTNLFQGIDVNVLIKASKNFNFRPCVEENPNAFMTETPWKMLQDQTINITFMVGSANRAGLHESLNHTNESLSEFNEDFARFLPNDLKFNGDSQKSELARQIRYLYFNQEEIDMEDLENLTICYTDAWYLGPGIRTARLLLEARAKVYFYEFAFVGKLNRELESLDTPIEGAVRGDIAGYIFTKDGQLISDSEDTKEKQMIQSMTDLWANFIKKGKPKSPNICWNELKKAEDSEEQWLLISNDDITQEEGLHVDRMRLWTQIYQNHFIEHNTAFQTKSIHCLTIFMAFLLVFIKTP